METKKRPDKKANDTELSPEKKAQQAKALAQVTLRPSANAAAVIAEYGKPFGNQDVIELVDVLVTSMTELNNGEAVRKYVDGAGLCPASHFHEFVFAVKEPGLLEKHGNFPTAGTESPKPMPCNFRDLGSNQEPARSLCQASQYFKRTSAGE